MNFAIRRIWALANEPAGTGFEPVLPQVFQQDLSKMHPDEMKEHAKSLSPEQRGAVLRKWKSDRAAAEATVSARPAEVHPAYSPEHEEAGDAAP